MTAGSEDALRDAVIAATLAMSRSGLSPGTSGNVSAWMGDGDAGEAGQHGAGERGAGGAMLITPTGVPYDDLVAESIVRVEADGSVAPGQLKPSSEWYFHLAVYHARPDAGGIVHTHSRHATALACTGRGIPPFHYMVAVAGGRDIPCAPYATFGTSDLARHISATLASRNACLMAHHGQIAIGPTVEYALALAQEVEILAAQYTTALSIGGVTLLDDDEMDRVLTKFASYGQQDD